MVARFLNFEMRTWNVRIEKFRKLLTTMLYAQVRTITLDNFFKKIGQTIPFIGLFDVF